MPSATCTLHGRVCTDESIRWPIAWTSKAGKKDHENDMTTRSDIYNMSDFKSGMAESHVGPRWQLQTLFMLCARVWEGGNHSPISNSTVILLPIQRLSEVLFSTLRSTHDITFRALKWGEERKDAIYVLLLQQESSKSCFSNCKWHLAKMQP